VETLHLVREAEPIPPSRLVPSVPRDLETICLKCLRKEPARRYATASELADDLRRLLAGSAIVARRAGNAARFTGWSRRNPVVVGLAAALLLTAAAGFWGALIQWRRAEAVRRESVQFRTELRTRQAADSLSEELRASRTAAYTLLDRGDIAGYRRACARMLERLGTSDDPWSASEVALACMQGPASVADLEQVVRLAEGAVAANPYVAWWHHALAGAYVRTGRYEQALRASDESDQAGWWSSRVLNDLVRALAYLRLGKRAQGRRCLDAALRWRDEHLKDAPGNARPEAVMPAFDWTSFEILRREAEVLLREPGLPAGPKQGRS
jgi:tetratricopeptide (TPR) repeat protein